VPNLSPLLAVAEPKAAPRVEEHGHFRRVAFLGGIYSNYLALGEALRLARQRDVDAIYALGDFGAFGPHPERTLEILREGGIERLYTLGDRLRSGLARAIAAAGVPACVAGWGSEWMVYFAPEPPRSYRDVLSTDLDLHERFRLALLAEGILEPPFATSDKRICVALSEADVDETVEAAARALAALA